MINGEKLLRIFVGQCVYELTTPYIVTNMEVLDVNMKKMGDFLKVEVDIGMKRGGVLPGKPVVETKKQLKQQGCQPILSSGVTGTYDITGFIDGIDELQCGSYALMGSAYKKIRPEFEFVRYIQETVISDQADRITQITE